MKLPDLSEVRIFLGEPTPQSWLQEASKPAHLPQLLSEHADLEQKAAQSALTTIRRYAYGVPGIARATGRQQGPGTSHAPPPQADLLHKMSRLAREELRHFEQVLAIMTKRKIPYQHVSASRYASGLRTLIRSQEPARLVDTLIAGAFIEARSCERFAALAPFLDDELGGFYLSLLKSEARHYQDYLCLASRYSQQPIEPHIARFQKSENALIVEVDDQFRFHSGVPSVNATVA